ncbi:hypothetical protein ACFYXQ_03625 [Nocardia jiangxiensis]|uniref:Uncharacterized protein n=1 Tax=Nocardia jiangxiensis TaxID=282685 RepID=A0ABW6RS71_9NOCA
MTPDPRTNSPLSTAEWNARLAAAHAMPPGPAREQAITELVLAAIVAEIGQRAPSVRYAEFDWAPYGGLAAVGFLDARGAEVDLPVLAGDLAQWSSDLRSPDLAGMFRVALHGPFLLDLHTHHPAPEPAPTGQSTPTRQPDLDAPQPHSTPTPDPKDSPVTHDSAATGPRPLTVHGVPCPVQVGQRVVLAIDPDEPGVVRAVYFHRGGHHVHGVDSGGPPSRTPVGSAAR